MKVPPRRRGIPVPSVAQDPVTPSVALNAGRKVPRKRRLLGGEELNQD